MTDREPDVRRVIAAVISQCRASAHERLREEAHDVTHDGVTLRGLNAGIHRMRGLLGALALCDDAAARIEDDPSHWPSRDMLREIVDRSEIAHDGARALRGMIDAMPAL